MLSMSLSHIHDVIKSRVARRCRSRRRRRASRSRIRCLTRRVPVTYLDNTQVVQVFSCLIQNAIKFTDGGGSARVETMFTGKEIW